MNVYLVKERDEAACWMAPTMRLALQAAFEAYLKEERKKGSDLAVEDEVEFYEIHILESCALVGELANPPDAS